MEYTVQKTRKERSKDGSHEHIVGVCSNGTYFPRQKVVESINFGNTWKTQAGGSSAQIRVIGSCPKSGCAEASPYITTDPNRSRADNLDNLPPC